MEENSVKRQRGIGIGIAIFNVIVGCVGFVFISFAEVPMWINYAVMAVLWIGLFAGLFFGIRLLVLDKRKASGITAVILTGIMLLLFAVDNVVILREQIGDWGGDESSFAVESDFPSKKPISNLNQADIQSDTVIWINAIYAIPTYADSRDYRFIGGTMPYVEDTSNLELMLESAWRVTDRRSAVECVEKLIQKGHQSSYMEYMEKLSQQGLLNLEEDEVREYFEEKNLQDKELNKYIAAYRIYKNDAENGIIAWDYCRAVQLLGYYYVMDYITLEECMDKSLEIAKQLQSTYDSWDEMANSYLLGYEFWSGQSLNEYGTDAYARKSEYEEIMEYEAYIFAIDWNYELQDTWTGVEHSVETEDIYDVVCDAYTDYIQRMGYEIEESHWLNDFTAEEYEEETAEDAGKAEDETGSPSEEFIKEKTAQLNGNMENFVAAGVSMEIGMQFKEVMNQLEYERVSEDKKLNSYEVLYVADEKAKDAIMIALHANEEHPKDLGEMYIGSVSVYQALSDDMEVVPSHSVLANGIHIGSTRRELVDAFEKSGLTLVQDEGDSYQYVCNTEDCSYLILMDNYGESKDEDIVSCMSIQTIEWD